MPHWWTPVGEGGDRDIGWSAHTRSRQGGERGPGNGEGRGFRPLLGISSLSRVLRSESSTGRREHTSFATHMRATGSRRFSTGMRRAGRASLGLRGPSDLSGGRVYARSAQVGGVPPRARRLAPDPNRPSEKARHPAGLCSWAVGERLEPRLEVGDISPTGPHRYRGSFRVQTRDPGISHPRWCLGGKSSTQGGHHDPPTHHPRRPRRARRLGSARVRRAFVLAARGVRKRHGYVANHTEGTVSVTLGKQLSGKAKIIDGRHR